MKCPKTEDIDNMPAKKQKHKKLILQYQIQNEYRQLHRVISMNHQDITSDETYTNYLDAVDIDSSCQNRNMPHEFDI